MAEMELTEQQRTACADLEDTWYWQVQERGKWRYSWHNEVMVRYYECAPLEADVFPAMIEYLQGQTGITHIQLHGKRINLDGEWKAVRAWYETRDGDTSETNKLKRVRICQALAKNPEDVGGDGPYVVEDGCRYKVSHTFHWNADALPELPESSSGVNWQIQAATRDDETGLWHCVVEKRERVQQDIPEYTTETTAFETKKEERHLGVKQGNVEGTGKEASVSDGKIVTRKLEKNEDCTTDVINETTEEKPVSDAIVETERRLEGVVVTSTDRNQSSAPDASTLKTGDKVTVRKTDGGLLDVTRRTVEIEDRNISAGHEETALVHSDTTRAISAEDPGSMDTNFRVGEIKERRKRTIEAGEGWEVEERTRTAKAVSTHVEWDDEIENGTSTSKYRCGVYVYRNWDTMPAPPDFKHVTCSVSINEFGLLDITFHGQTLTEWNNSSRFNAHDSGTLTQDAKTVEKRKAWKNIKTGRLTFAPSNKRDYYKVDVVREVTAKKHTKWGGRLGDMVNDAASGINRPDLGFVSKISGGMVVYYNNLTPASKWTEAEGSV